jgi:hypothetical protein
MIDSHPHVMKSLPNSKKRQIGGVADHHILVRVEENGLNDVIFGYNKSVLLIKK